jgi:hypothetical protein
MAQLTVARVRRGSVGAKIETTYGTDATLAAADLVEARNIVFRAVQEALRDERQGGFVAQLPDIPGARSATLGLETLQRGANVAYSATVKPPDDALLRMCGLAAVGSFVATLEKWTYTPQAGATMGEAGTAALFAENAPNGKLLGALGTFRMAFRAGEPLVHAYALAGIYSAPADVALLTVAPSTIQPPIFKSGVVTIGGTTHRVQAIDLDLGNDVQLLRSANAADAVAGVLIANRRVTLTFDPDQVTAATFDWHNKRDLATQMAASWQVGTAQYNRIKFSASRLQVIDVAEGTRGGVRTFQVTATLNATAGGDELSIVYD